MRTLVFLFVNMAIISHFVGCMWNLLSYFENTVWQEENTWVHNVNMWDTIWYKRYAECFYWATATMMLVGSKGDTFIETIFCTLTLFTTIGAFAYILGNIASILEELKKD